MCNILSQDIKINYKTILVFSLITYTENIEGRWEIKHFCREKKKKFSINGLARSMLVYVGDKTSSTDLQRELHTITRTKERLEQKIDNSSKSFQQRNNRVFQLENNLHRQQNICKWIQVHLQEVDWTTIHTEISDKIEVKTGVVKEQTKVLKIQQIYNLFCWRDNKGGIC